MPTRPEEFWVCCAASTTATKDYLTEHDSTAEQELITRQLAQPHNFVSPLSPPALKPGKLNGNNMTVRTKE
jgi:hypothetical protein